MKTKSELNALKKEVETLNQKLAELSDDELEAVTGGMILANDGSSTISTPSSLACGWTKREIQDK